MEDFIRSLSYLDLPSSMWGIHIHPHMEFIGVFHINISSTKLVIDKGIVLTQEEYNFGVKIFLNGFVCHVPNIILNIRDVSELSALIHLLHNKDICKNVEKDEYGDCLKLLDKTIQNESFLCTTCEEKYILTEITNTIEESHNYVPDIVENELTNNQHDTLQENDCNVNFSLQTNVIYDEHNETILVLNNKNTKERSKGKQVLCNVCGKLLINYRIEEHMLTHTQDKPYQCNICNKTFSKNFNLKMHENTHYGGKPYICNVCGRSYTTSSNLRSHILSSHQNNKKYACEICNMTFLYPRYLKIHMRKHTGERPFVCSICGKKFSKNVHLTMHTRTHTGEKPHCCKTCGKGYATSGGLGYHKKVHHKGAT